MQSADPTTVKSFGAPLVFSLNSALGWGWVADRPELPDGYGQIFRSYVFGPSGFWTMAPLCFAAKFDPFLSLDCAPTPSTLAQSKERKGSNFAIWQPCLELGVLVDPLVQFPSGHVPEALAAILALVLLIRRVDL